MKSEASNGILTVVLGALLVLGVFFALKVVFVTHELRTLQGEANQANTALIRAQAILNDTQAYYKLHPDADLQRILQPFQRKTATR